MNIIKKIINGTLRALPDKGRLIKTSVRQLLVQKELIRLKMNLGADAADLPDPRTVYWIDPALIEFHTSLKTDSSDWEDWVFPQLGHMQIIQNGDWDVSSLKVADMRIYHAVEARINHGASWESTDYYQTAIRQIAAGRYLWDCQDRSSFDRHCAKIDKLIESMIKMGYQESRQLGHAVDLASSLGHKEIIVNISREGLPLFQDGRHRLAVARILKIKEIPVQIFVRHTEWQAFRIFMQRKARSSSGTEKECSLCCQSPIHFDLGAGER